MRKNILLRCMSLVLTSALFLAGCGHDTRTDTAFPADVSGSNGGPAAAAVAAAAAVGGPAFPNNNFLLNPITETQVVSQNSPTQIITAGNRVYYIGGFRDTNNQGRLFVAEIPSPFAANSVPTFVPVRDANANPVAPFTFRGAFGVVALDPSSATSDLFVSTGFNTAQDGQIVRVSGVTIANGVATGTFARVGNNVGTGAILNPTFMMIGRDINGVGNRHLFWSEYAGAPNGRVRRIRVDANAGANPVAENIVAGLSFPAGIATNGQDLYICDSAGGANGQVLRTPLNWAGQTLDVSVPNPANPNVITPIAAEVTNTINRPFDITYDGRSGMFFTEGAVISFTGFTGPIATGQPAGRVRYLPTGSDEAAVVSTGLNNVGGIAATQLTATGTTVGLVFVETASNNGRILRRSVDTAAIVAGAPEQISINQNFALDVAIINIFQPLFVTTENYIDPNSNGIINFYSSTGT